MKKSNLFSGIATSMSVMQATPSQQQQGIADWFGGSGQQQQQQETQQQQQQQAQQANSDPAQQQQQQQQSVQEENPLAIFDSLYDNATDGEGDAPPQFSLDPTKVAEAAGKIDFMTGVNKDDVSAMQNGDTEAMMRIMQTVARNSYAQALQHSSALTDQFVTNRSEFDSKRTPSLVREVLTSSELSADGSKLPDTVRKGLSEIAGRLQRKHPDASPKEIASMAKEYYIQNAAAMLGMSGDQMRTTLQSNQQAQQSKAAQEVDWDKYFS